MIREFLHAMLRRRLPRQIWLTFDDGPHPHHTPQILAILKRHGIPATFFMVGKNAAAYPDLVARVAQEGHSLGNHTLTHPDITILSSENLQREILETQSLLAPHATQRPLFRAPYKRINESARQTIESLGFTIHEWTVDTRDWDPALRSHRWVAHAMPQLLQQTKSVVLMHELYESTPQHLEDFILRLKRLGPTTFYRLTDEAPTYS